jgi:hypothetical protein
MEAARACTTKTLESRVHIPVETYSYDAVFLFLPALTEHNDRRMNITFYMHGFSYVFNETETEFAKYYSRSLRLHETTKSAPLFLRFKVLIKIHPHISKTSHHFKRHYYISEPG